MNEIYYVGKLPVRYFTDTNDFYSKWDSKINME